MARNSRNSDPAAGVDDTIRIRGARVHNLRSVDLELPKNALICMTGVSGSGKSSLAFDTLYAEGQRRYIESLSSYARQFLGELPKPDVDQISGLTPAISIQQKTSGWNPRSTVGTITQIHDYLRVLYARAGEAHCPTCDQPITAQTREQMLGRILELPADTALVLLAPKAKAQKGEHKDLFDELTRRGFVRARVDGEIVDLASAPDLDRHRRHDIEVVVDRLVIREGVRPRLAEALDLALQEGAETAIVSIVERAAANDKRRKTPAATAPPDMLLSAGYACNQCNVSFEPPTPQMFSFNSPQGMCPNCDGLGTCFDFDPELMIPDPAKSFLAPCVVPFRTKIGRWQRHLYAGVAAHFGVDDLDQPWQDLPAPLRRALLYGTGNTHITFHWHGRRGSWKHGGTFEGIIAELHGRYRKSESALVRGFYEQFMRTSECAVCNGARLLPQPLAIRLSGPVEGAPQSLNIHDLCRLSIARALAFVEKLRVEGVRARIAEEPLKEIRARLRFLLDVGLDYLTLDRSAPTLSGGESQRIRLASQIGSGLVGVLYVLDEPSIGLHARDNLRLLASLQRLRDLGNTVVVVEHDQETIEAADHIVDFGPHAGVRGGQVMASGDLDSLRAAPDSVTGAFLAGREKIEIPKKRRPITPRQ